MLTIGHTKRFKYEFDVKLYFNWDHVVDLIFTSDELRTFLDFGQKILSWRLTWYHDPIPYHRGGIRL